MNNLDCSVGPQASLPPSWPCPRRTLAGSCSGSHRHLPGCSFDKTSTDQGLGPSIPQRSTVDHTLCPLPLEKNRHIRKTLRAPRKPSECFFLIASILPLPPHWSDPPNLLSTSSHPCSHSREAPSLTAFSQRPVVLDVKSLFRGPPKQSGPVQRVVVAKLLIGTYVDTPSTDFLQGPEAQGCDIQVLHDQQGEASAGIRSQN